MSNAQQNNPTVRESTRQGLEYLYRLGKTLLVVMLGFVAAFSALFVLMGFLGKSAGDPGSGAYVLGTLIGWGIWARLYAKSKGVAR